MEKYIHLRCNNCSKIFIFTGNNPIKDNVTFCPSCGNPDVKISNKAFNYWEELEKETKIPREILKEMFSVWDREEYPSFYDYVKSFMMEAA